MPLIAHAPLIQAFERSEPSSATLCGTSADT
jgi:hypothetical protein